MDSKRKPYHLIRAYGAVGNLRAGRRKAPPSMFFSLRTTGQIKKRGGESREGGHKRHVWKPIMKGQKPLYGVIRPVFPPGPIGDLVGSALGE